MGNNQNQNKLRDKIKFVLKLKTPKQTSTVLSKLPIEVVSQISSFLTIKDNYHVLLVSSTIYQLFESVSSCYQIHCQNILKIKSEIIHSKKWKKIIYQLYCIPIKGIPYERSLKSICYNVKQHPTYFENEQNYSAFQKCILYFEEQFIQLNTIEFQQVKKFAQNHFEYVLRLRQGQEINIQLPHMLMNIYNIQDFVRIFNIYLEIRFQTCNLEQFLELWDRYCGWISIMEWSTLQLICQFNQIIDEVLNKYKLPKFTFRHFMITLWIQQYEMCKFRLQNEFKKKMIDCRIENQKVFELRNYIKYLIDISTNQLNVHQYGYHNFQYDQEVINLTNLASEITMKLSRDYQTDKEMLIYIFGDQIFQQILFHNLQQHWLEQFIEEIKKHSLTYQIVSEIQEAESKILKQYNKRQQIKVLISSVLVKESSCTSEILESKQSNSCSQISQVSTNYSSVYTTQNEILLTYISATQPEFYRQMEDFFQLQDQINEQSQDYCFKQPHYDVPELCAYTFISYDKLVEQLYIKKQPQRKIIQQQAYTTAQEMLQKVLN